MTESRRPRRLRSRRWLAASFAFMLLSAFTVPASGGSPAQAQAFDFDRGNALLEVVFPTLQPRERVVVSKTGGDATLIVDLAMLMQTAAFDSIAPYHPTAVGFFSNFGRRPASEATDRNRNIALIYSHYRIFLNRMPQFRDDWRAMLTSVGLDPDDNRENTRTAAGLGNLAARAALEGRRNDGTNRWGDEGGRTYNQTPYAEHTGYQPVNTAYTLHNPSRWQPDVEGEGNGVYKVQQFLTAHMGRVRPFTFDQPTEFRAPVPVDSDVRNRKGYKRQVDEVLAESANLNDERKMKAEMFNDKFLSLAAIPGTAAWQTGKLTLEEFVHYISTVEVALFDTAIVTWHYKRYYDTVRPFSAVRYLYGSQRITAWGGSGQGTVDDITGTEWEPYLQTHNHADYPSGTASFCSAYTEAARRFLGTDDIQITVPRPAGSSLVEPGLTPADDMTLTWNNWTDYSTECGMSRVWGGVHFKAATQNVKSYAPLIGQRAYQFVQGHINGDV